LNKHWTQERMAAASAAGAASGSISKGRDVTKNAAGPRSMRTGRYLASLMTVAESVDDHSTTGDAGAAAAMERRVKDAAMIEMNHEIIGLGDKLVINEENLAELRASVDPDAAALVVSFLGDTSAGKSHTIRELMSVSESRPYCQEARGQSVATTFNVNLFPCQTIAPGMVVHLVDYEGENGSNTPIMMAVSSDRVTLQPGSCKMSSSLGAFGRLSHNAISRRFQAVARCLGTIACCF
jgi:hypothetical protein